ncbi:uncharacterized protein UTRI_06517_B [Ustilago trichophora]|uniref:Protein PBN1 n=1 Tax=Ustilago trichophora TaxID=86804 RepID=A0A5C3EQP0_9BASI|nr:uncharacterized protein UTRI_06517_B [Ustilago trichophora]
MNSTLTNSHSFHPTLSLSLPSSLLPTASQCKPSILVHLPPGIFYDPYTAGNAQSRGGKRGYEVQYLHSATMVELEGAVGFSGRRKGRTGRREGEQWWEINHSFEKGRGEAEGEGVGGDDGGMQGLLEAVLREKVAEYTAEPVVTGEQRVRHKLGAKAKQPKGSVAKKQETQEVDEVSSLLIELNVDELRSQDELTLDLPLHLRYHPPSNLLSTTTTRPNTNLPAAHSPYLTLILDILPSSLPNLLHQTKHSLLSLLGQKSPSYPSKSNSRNTHYAHSSISQPTLFLNCHQSSSTYIQGFYSTTFNNLFPPTHSHLIPTKAGNNNSAVLTLSNKNSTKFTNPLSVRVPTPNPEWLAPVQITTLTTIISAALGVLYWLLIRIVPLLQDVEGSL